MPIQLLELINSVLTIVICDGTEASYTLFLHR